VRHKNGPFRKLENVWGFTPRGETASDVSFAIDYEFSSPVLAVLMGAVFDTAFRKFAAAFEERAGEVYGRRAPVSSALG
jgi:coenzyme Q-binding protein COQ10